MKKFKGRDFMSGVLLGSLLLSGVSYASSSIRLIVDGKEIQSDVPPQVIDGRVMVPARFLAGSLGAKVDWDASSNSVIVTSKEDGYVDIPGNINPVFIFFKYLFVDSNVSQQQFKNSLDGEALTDQLTRGISEVQFSDVREIARKNKQVEFSATFNVKRNKGYSGPLNEGVNQLFFLVEKEGDMLFKIVSYGTGPHLLTEEEHSRGLSEANPSNIPPISELDVVRLVAKATAHYWYISSGGGSTGEGEIKEFPIEGKGDHYRWMGKDLETKAKYISYLEEVFTPEKVQEFWNKQVKAAAIVEVNGRLAQPNADGGSLARWGEAKAKLMKNEKDRKKFHFDVPMGELGQEQHEITVRYVEGKGWRIDENVETIH